MQIYKGTPVVCVAWEEGNKIGRDIRGKRLYQM